MLPFALLVGVGGAGGPFLAFTATTSARRCVQQSLILVGYFTFSFFALSKSRKRPIKHQAGVFEPWLTLLMGSWAVHQKFSSESIRVLW